MRGAFIRTLTRLAEDDSRVLFLTGDLGFMAVEPFSERFPNRFFNMGVAEQNMVAVATGLAESGFLPFTYSIATFAALRPYEFIRNGPVLHQLPVRIVGVGGGFEYGTAGSTHHAIEDVAVMRVQPGLTVLAPADHQQTQTVLEKTWDLPGPVYYRLGKDDRRVVDGLDGRFDLGRAQQVREGADVLILALGSVATEAVGAADDLAAHDVGASAAVVASVNPAPSADLGRLLATAPLVVTVEAHYVVGGLGSLVAETIAEGGLPTRLVRCGVREPFDGLSASESFLNDRHGLSRAAITKLVLAELQRSP